MWFIVGLLCSAFAIHNFFYVTKESDIIPGLKMTDASRVSNLYNSIRCATRSREYTTSEVTRGVAKAGYRTFQIIAELKWMELLNYIFAPRRLDDNFIVLSYYYGRRWYTAIVPHPKRLRFKSKIRSMITIDHMEERDVTDTLIPYTGPLSNFYGQAVMPSSFGLENLTIRYDPTSVMEDRTFLKYQPMN